jgi:hypothetical protein
VLAGGFEAGGQAEQLALVDSRSRLDRDQVRAGLGERAGLVHHEGVHTMGPFDRLRIAEQDAGAGTAPSRGRAQSASWALRSDP